MADGGTIFLDEIGELPMPVQAKLLQVLEQKTFERVGESTSTSVDFRVISSTNQDLGTYIREEKFRQDLYYRLARCTSTFLPCGNAVEDIPLLVGSLYRKIRRSHAKTGSPLHLLGHRCLVPLPLARKCEGAAERGRKDHDPEGGHTMHRADIDPCSIPLNRRWKSRGEELPDTDGNGKEAHRRGPQALSRDDRGQARRSQAAGHPQDHPPIQDEKAGDQGRQFA